MTPAAPGDAFEAHISGLGSVRVRFAEEAAEAKQATEGNGK
jgi:2-keto-4-pentenoate hydratase